LIVSIRVGNTAFSPQVRPETPEETDVADTTVEASNGGSQALLTALLGTTLSGLFYGMVWTVPWEPLQRYFLGHPIAVAATVLFWFAVAVLVSKWLAVVTQANQLSAIRDEDLLPPPLEAGPADRWLEENDAGHVARRWLSEIGKLPSEIRGSHLVHRLEELLTRQSQRGSTKHLADDLRELSARDADAAHDSLGLVRIIIWAIPMLGFLGTVIGITQTLGGLDFTNGSAAVENLKSGLYVAFDTTAIGLVLSVLAIFLQFPIERSEQRLLAVIDARVGHLLSASLPSDETSDNQTALIADLCRGVQAAVAESLENQAQLWRETIDEAQRHWQLVHDDNANRIVEAIESSLIPALANHAEDLASASAGVSRELGANCQRWRETLDQAQSMVRQANEDSANQLIASLETTLHPSLTEHAATIDDSAQMAADRLEKQLERWEKAIHQHSETLVSQQESVVRQFEALADTQRGTESILALQQSLDANLQRLNATNEAIDRSISAAAGDGMAEAMLFLARAVDVLSKRLPEPEHEASRRAA
jgi:biopolymer transport protein ExbB/TolQ